MARPCPELPAAGDKDDLVGARPQFGVNVGEEIVEPACFAEKARERLARNRPARAAGAQGGRDRERALEPAAPYRRRGRRRKRRAPASPPSRGRGRLVPAPRLSNEWIIAPQSKGIGRAQWRRIAKVRSGSAPLALSAQDYLALLSICGRSSPAIQLKACEFNRILT